MVLYLNRLLCVRFGLALGYGGLRERPVEELCSWMSSEPPAEEPLVAPPLQGSCRYDASLGIAMLRPRRRGGPRPLGRARGRQHADDRRSRI